MTSPTDAMPTSANHDPATEPMLDKYQLRDALGLKSTRIIDEWVRKKMITSIPLGHRTLRFFLSEVLEDLAKFKVMAVWRRKK